MAFPSHWANATTEKKDPHLTLSDRDLIDAINGRASGESFLTHAGKTEDIVKRRYKSFLTRLVPLVNSNTPGALEAQQKLNLARDRLFPKPVQEFHSATPRPRPQPQAPPRPEPPRSPPPPPRQDPPRQNPPPPPSEAEMAARDADLQRRTQVLVDAWRDHPHPEIRERLIDEVRVLRGQPTHFRHVMDALAQEIRRDPSPAASDIFARALLRNFAMDPLILYPDIHLLDQILVGIVTDSKRLELYGNAIRSAQSRAQIVRFLSGLEAQGADTQERAILRLALEGDLFWYYRIATPDSASDMRLEMLLREHFPNDANSMLRMARNGQFTRPDLSRLQPSRPVNTTFAACARAYSGLRSALGRIIDRDI